MPCIMFDNLLNRLRDAASRNGRHKFAIGDYWNFCDEAADRIEALEAENAALREDAERLMFATREYDGFSNVKNDKHDFAAEVAAEMGHDEPTREDEIEGLRRLIDAARRKQ